MAIKIAESALKRRVGRVSGNTGIFRPNSFAAFAATLYFWSFNVSPYLVKLLKVFLHVTIPILSLALFGNKIEVQANIWISIMDNFTLIDDVLDGWFRVLRPFEQHFSHFETSKIGFCFLTPNYTRLAIFVTRAIFLTIIMIRTNPASVCLSESIIDNDFRGAFVK